ncbi:unnamed protein product, partial [marine sediment metagenome]
MTNYKNFESALFKLNHDLFISGVEFIERKLTYKELKMLCLINNIDLKITGGCKYCIYRRSR